MRTARIAVILIVAAAALSAAACAPSGTGRWIAAPAPSPSPTGDPLAVGPPIGRYDPSRDAGQDLGDAVALAAASKRHVLVIFGAEWCPACHSLANGLASTTAADALRRGYVTVMVDVGQFDRNLALAHRYVRLESLPSVVVLDGTGTVLTTSDRERPSGYDGFTVSGYLARWAPKK
jgi:protein disulfide-isomerase